jgi:hypothetical protein
MPLAPDLGSFSSLVIPPRAGIRRLAFEVIPAQAGIHFDLVVPFVEVQSFHSPFGRAGYFLCLCKESNQRNTPPVSRLPGILPSRYASVLRRFADRTSMCAQRTGAHPARHPCGLFPPHARRATGGPVWAASCRRSNGNSSRPICVEANDPFDAVQGCTDSWTNAPFAVPSIAGSGEKGPKGRAHDARASAAVHGCTVSRPRRCREAQGSSIRTMRIEPPRWALDLFGYFLGQCQKVTRSPQASGSSALRTDKGARSWIPASAGMTSKRSGWIPACAGMTSGQSVARRLPASAETTRKKKRAQRHD